MRQAEKFRNFAGAASQTEKAMDVEEFGAYCLSLSGVTEQMPFTVPNDAYGRDSADALVRRLVESFYRFGEEARSAAKTDCFGQNAEIPVAFAYICLRDIPIRSVPSVFDPPAGVPAMKMRENG